MGSLQADTCISPLLLLYSLQLIKLRKMKVFLLLSVLVLVFGFSNGKTFLVETAEPRNDGNSITISLPEKRRGFWDGSDEAIGTVDVKGFGQNKGESNELCIGNVCNGVGAANFNNVKVRVHGQNFGGSNELCIGNVCSNRRSWFRRWPVADSVSVEGDIQNSGEHNRNCVGNICS